MQQALAYSTLAVTVTLALWRPRLRPSQLRFSPGSAAVLGVIILVATRLLAVEDLWGSLRIQWRPLLSLACIIVMTGVVDELLAFDRLVAQIETYARRTSASRAFSLVFFLGVLI